MYAYIFGKKYLPHRSIIALILGIIAGIMFHDFSVWMAPFGTAFMNLIKMLIVPVVFFSLSSGIAMIGDVNRLKRVGLKILAVYVAMTILACLIGILIAYVFNPGEGFDTSGLTNFDPSKVTTPSFSGFLLDMIPTNVIDAMAKSDIMKMVFFTVILGISLVLLGDKVSVFTQFLNQGATLTYKMLDIVMIYSPIGIFALMANVTAVYGSQLFSNLAQFVVADWTGCFLIWLTFSLIVKFYTGINYRGLCKEMIPIWCNTMATTSSSGTIPITMEVTHRLKLPTSLCSFSIPLGATINLSGAALYKTLLAFFVAQIYGLELTMPQIIMVITISTLMSIAAPGIPGGGIITGAIFLNLLGLPFDLMGPIAGMYRLIDMSHTTVNVSGDVLGSMLVAKNENLWSGKTYNDSIHEKTTTPVLN